MTLMDWMNVGLAFAGLIGVPAGTWGISSIVSLDKKFTTHEAVDDARFRQISESLKDLKDMAAAHDVKLDRAIERLPYRRGRDGD